MTKSTIPMLDRAQAAALAGLTIPVMSRMERENTFPPPWNGLGYPAPAFAKWLELKWLRDRGQNDDGAIDYNREKARLTRSQADKAELEAESMRGNLLPADVVAKSWARMCGTIRARMLGVHSKTAPRARAAGTDEEAAAIIEAAIIEALEELANGLSGDAESPGALDAGGSAPAAEDDGEPVGGRVSAAQPRKRGRARKVVDG